MQCGYRSKVCTNTRATKIDGSLHNLCEFHRRKANSNQQRLHQRQREERVKRRRAETATKNRPTKKTRLNIEIPVDPIPFVATEAVDFSASINYYPSSFVAEELSPMSLSPVDNDILELLLLDVQQLPLPNSPTAVDDDDCVVV
ncbi:hypothetical protein PHMEG_00027815 [Phytophthora megakarya]|uniref:Uncharacterized protein n=1 Tax=Phytophthora megakarya TaxID=4795 RepID=A0A225V7M1_9STRA|nr:hypothetical protein PHMEG_00027815 [Phytophthora megakarya]